LPPRKQVLEVDGDIGQVQKRDQVAFGSEEWRRRLFIFSDKLLSLYKVADCDSEEQVVEWLRCREASVQPSLTICNIRLPDGSKAEVSMRKLAQAYGFEMSENVKREQDLRLQHLHEYAAQLCSQYKVAGCESEEQVVEWLQSRGAGSVYPKGCYMSRPDGSKRVLSVHNLAKAYGFEKAGENKRDHEMRERRVYDFAAKLHSQYKVADCESEEQVAEWLLCRGASVYPRLNTCHMHLPDGSKAELSIRKLAEAYGFQRSEEVKRELELQHERLCKFSSQLYSQYKVAGCESEEQVVEWLQDKEAVVDRLSICHLYISDGPKMSLTLRQLAEAHVFEKAGEAKKKAEARQKRVHDFAKKLYSQYKVDGCESEEEVVEWLQNREAVVNPSLFECDIYLSDGPKARFSMRQLAEAFGFEKTETRKREDERKQERLHGFAKRLHTLFKVEDCASDKQVVEWLQERRASVSADTVICNIDLPDGSRQALSLSGSLLTGSILRRQRFTRRRLRTRINAFMTLHLSCTPVTRWTAAATSSKC